MKNNYSFTCFAVVTLLFLAVTSITSAQVIRTVAGNGNSGYYNDGGLADTTTLNVPAGSAIDKAGNIFFADRSNHRIREVIKATGKIATVAGDGSNGFYGDGGSAGASSVQFSYPNAVALDTAGNIYIADEFNNRIREIVKNTGIINTIAGGYAQGFSDGSASTTLLNNPVGVAVDDSGNVYFADAGNYRIRKLYAATNIVTTIAGNGTSAYYTDGGLADTSALAGPTGVAVDKYHNVYFSDYGGIIARVRRIDAKTNIITTVAGSSSMGYLGDGGAATLAELNIPNGVTIDTAGNLYIADAGTNSNIIRFVNASTGIINTFAGQGSYYGSFGGDGSEASYAYFNGPSSVSLDDSGNVYISDQGNQRIREVFVNGPKIISQPSSYLNFCIGSGGTIGISATGKGTITYQWEADSNYSNKWTVLTNTGNYSGVNTDSLKIITTSTQYSTIEYRCIINNGYDTSEISSIYVNPLPYVTLTVPSDSICPGVPTSLTANGQNASKPSTLGLGQYGTAIWSTGDSTNTITVSPTVTTTYTVALTQYGCTKDTSVTVFVDRTKINPIAFPSSTTCAGNSISLQGQGGDGSYSWSGGVTNGQSFIPSKSATYTVQAIDEAGCKITDSIKVHVNSLPVITITDNLKDTVCYGSQEILTASGASTYTWNNGINNSTPFTIYSSNTYSVTATDINGCVNTAVKNIMVNPLPVITGSAIPSAVCAGSSVTLSGNGGASYSWSNGVSNGKPFVPTSSGTYTVTGTGTNGCMNTGSVSVTVNPLPSISATAFPSATLCQGSTLALFGSGGASYAWSGGVNNGVSFTPFSTTTYTVSGIDANGCINKDSIKVTVHKKVVPTITSTNTSCGLKNGMASVIASNGIPPYSYNWSTTPSKSTASVDSLAAGTYVVSVSDSANCASTVAVSIASSTAPILSVSTTNSNCGSIGTGSASVTVNGGTAPYHYMWNNGDTLASNYNLKAATYIITVTDVTGCSTFAPAIVTNANGPKINTLSTVNVKCYGDATGAINIHVTGGTAPYQYSWSNGATTASISSLYSGPYQLTVTDADSCTSVETFTIGQPHTPMAATTSSVKADCGVADGSASVVVTGGSSPYIYAWNNTSTAANNTNIMAGVYSVIITDNNGCKDSAHVSVSDKTGPSLMMSLSGNATCGSGGLLSVTASGPNAPFTYAWSNGASTTSISNVPAGNYNVTVTDSKGCTSSADTTVSELTPPGLSLCMVTVDPLSNKHNIIVWDKSNTPKIASYNIYKESTAAGVYFKIASVPYKVLGTYVDSLSDPTVRSWRYKISQVDSCGNESPLSANHKTMHLTVNQGLGGNINLIWDNYEGLNFHTYYVYRDTIATNFTLIDSIPNNIFTYTDNNPLRTKKPLLYRIGISNPGGCTPSIEAINYNASKSNTGAVTFNPSLGINTINVFSSLQIFPNPSTGRVTFSVELPGSSQDLSLTVLNTLGQELMTADYWRVSGSFSKEIDLSNLAKGVYFFKLKTNNNTTYRKVVVQ